MQTRQGQEKEKQMAGQAAAFLVEGGMVLGLGTGSTVAFFLEALCQKVRDGMKVCGVPTSEGTATLCRQFGIELLESASVKRIDLAIDGADEIDTRLRMIKGGGGALLREKLIAEMATKVVIVVDSAKTVNKLGKMPLPIEVVRFGYTQVKRRLMADFNFSATLRFSGNSPYVTDNGNYILDCSTGFIHEPEKLATQLKSITGIIDSGLFVNHCNTVIIGKENETIVYSVQSRERPEFVVQSWE